MDSPERICGMCLKKCNDYKAVGGYITDVLGILLLKINLAVSEVPVVCTNCADTLTKCFHFKSACLYTYDFLVPFVDDKKNGKINLKDVYQSKLEYVVKVSEDQKVCGFCMGIVKSDSAISLCTKQRSVVVETMLEKYLPELDLNIIEEPVMCESCDTSLKDWFQFVINLSAAGENVMKYDEAADEGVRKPSEVLEVAIKEEKCSEDEENANNDVMKTEEQTVLLPEKIEIKTEEEQDFDSCQDGSLLPQSEDSTNLRKVQGCPEDNLLGHCPNTFCETGDNETYKQIEKVSLTNPLEITMHHCPTCSYQSRYKSALSRHMLRHKDLSDVKMYQCAQCSFQTKHESYLSKHTMFIHEDLSGVKVYQCESCPFQTRVKQCLKNHVLTHKSTSELTMYQCPSCPYQTKFKQYLTKHVKKHKSPSELTMYQCESCPYQTRFKESIKNHMLLHKSPSELTMYQCASCPYQTKCKKYLKSHMLTHKSPSELTMYQCATCPYQTKHKKYLKDHMLTHKSPSELTMHQCTLCPHQTKFKHYLKRHMLTHKSPSN